MVKLSVSRSSSVGQTRPHPGSLLHRSRATLLAILLVLTVSTWAVTIDQARTSDMAMGIAARSSESMDPMSTMTTAGMAAQGWSLGGAVIFLGSWAVMMAAMMFPAVVPVLLLFARVSAQRTGGGTASGRTWAFAAGYLLVWTAIGAVVYVLVQFGSDAATRLSPEDRARWAPYTLGAILVAAGVYQVTPLKRVCLNHCRTPLGYLMEHWHDGPTGALRMGLHHGLFCLGCCWALFAVLVAAGVMSLGWMVLLTLVVFVEKVFPVGRRVATVAGIALTALGVLVATSAVGMPWAA